MRHPELSISFRAEADERVLQETAEIVGKYDFDVISVYEDLGDQSPMYPLITLAKHAPTARLGPACVVVPKYTTMEPIVGDIARLESIRPNNTYLGLAAGAWMEQVGIQAASVNQVREAALVSKYLLEKRDDGFHGIYYRVQPGFTVNYPTPRSKVPLLVGAWGANMAALAGEIADEIKVGGSANPRMVKIIRQRVSVGTKRAGRQPDDVGIVLGAVTVIDEDRERALYVARRRAVVYIGVIGRKDPTALADFPEEIAAITAAMAQGDIEAALQFLSDELLKRFVFAGTPADIIAQTEEIFAQGATRVEFGSPHGADSIEGIQLLGSKVVPHFKRCLRNW